MPRRRGFSGGRRLFAEFVKEAVDSLPEEMKKELENIAILVEDEPPEDWEEEMGQGGELLGLYQGVSKKERGFWYGNVLPDCIIIYQKPLERLSSTREDLRENVRQTVVHEVGHYFGFDEEQLQNLEEGE
jgi:predicted Zn-dependent protease with MMP-like domain